MKPTDVTYKLVRSWMKAHVMFTRELVQRLQTVTSEPIGQPFGDEDNEYLITNSGIGYKVEYEINMNDGRLEFHAVPGRFANSNVGKIWVNGKTRLHSEIERNCDQKETSLIIH